MGEYVHFPHWLLQCLADEELTPYEWGAAEGLRTRFVALGVELDPIGAADDPDGIAAYTPCHEQVASECRHRSDPKGVYVALYRLCEEVARTQG